MFKQICSRERVVFVLFLQINLLAHRVTTLEGPEDVHDHDHLLQSVNSCRNNNPHPDEVDHAGLQPHESKQYVSYGKTVGNRTASKHSTCDSYLCRFREICGATPRAGQDESRLIKPLGGTRITHGSIAEYGEFPQYVKILRRGPGTSLSLCGGVLISDRHILTAGHCVADPYGNIFRPEHFEITAGDYSLYKLDKYEVTVKAKSICRAKRFYYDQIYLAEHDWAVITIKEKFIFNKYIRPACLVGRRGAKEIPMVGRDSECYVMGLGVYIASKTSIYPEILQKMRLVKTSCWSWIHKTEDESRVCFAGYHTRADTCRGDSGGPVLCRSGQRYTVVGLVSFGVNSCRGRSAVFTNVPSVFKDIRAECGI